MVQEKDLGDPVEMTALVRALPASAPPVLIGSVKSSLGHANIAAGMLGFIKTALCLHHRTVPPLAGFRTLKPLLQSVAHRIRIPTKHVRPHLLT
jgi:acyl transferase domain-containing protein